MARYAMVDDPSGIVVNVIEWDGDTATWQPPAGHTMVADTNFEIGVGFKLVGGAYRSPPDGKFDVMVAGDEVEAASAPAKPAPKKK